MRCPKCEYITLDQWESCPKCQADFFEAQADLNLIPGTLKPISISAILDRIGSATEIITPPPGPLEKGVPSKMSGPKTFELDLSDDTSGDDLTEKWRTKAREMPGRAEAGIPLDLTLEK